MRDALRMIDGKMLYYDNFAGIKDFSVDISKQEVFIEGNAMFIDIYSYTIIFKLLFA